MKKFISLNLLLITLFAVLGCSKEEDVEDTGAFFDVVYQTVETRENKNVPWKPVVGQMQMKVIQSNEEAGTFIFHYTGYREPQFVYNTCSGGFKGNFVITEASNTGGTTGGNYDPTTPYATPAPTTDDTTDTEDAGLIVSYYMAITITNRNMDSACRPESNRNIRIHRFTNGEIILHSEYRDLKMKPVLTTITDSSGT